MTYLHELQFRHKVRSRPFFSALRTHLLVAEVEELIELDPTVGERAERPLLLELGGEGGVGDLGVGLHERKNRTVSISFCAERAPPRGGAAWGQH